MTVAEAAWPELDSIDTTRIAAARRQAHNAVHWLSRVATSYGAQTANGSGNGSGAATTEPPLYWCLQGRAIRTPRFADGVDVELRLSPLEMQFRESGRLVPHVLDFDERSPAQVEAYLLVELLHRGVDRDRLSKHLTYPVKDLMSGDTEDYEPFEYAPELATIAGWIARSASILAELRAETGGNGAAEGTLRVWPKPFDVGFEIPGSGSSRLRVGVSAGDALRPLPFLFVADAEKAGNGDFDAGSVFTAQSIRGKGLDASAVKALVAEAVAAHRGRS